MRDAEVHQIGEVVGGEQHVLRLDVAVHQAVGVRVVERRGDLANDRHRPPRRQRTDMPQQRRQAVALDQPHVDVEHAVDLAEVVHRDDVRLLQPGRDFRLPAEPLLEAVVGGHLGAQQLDRDHALAGGVVGAVHLAHAAHPDHRLQLVGPEPGAQPRTALRGAHTRSFRR